MKDIKRLKGQSLRWFRLGWLRGHYELTGEDAEIYATLDWKGMFTERAIASCAYGDYALWWRGVLRRHVPIMDTASNQEIGRLKLGFGDSGFLEMNNGRRYRFRRTSLMNDKWVFEDDLGGIVCTLGFSGWLGMGRFGGHVLIGPGAVLDLDLMMMLIVGWYAMLVISTENALALSGGGG